ncbi:3-oxoacyl-[acyl-carrier-protein] reductase FabG-like [Oppia nitens]|uniref:3-oxoacyl-[acyl-carrier-protein] reductase FabG-like n=1 Tax=Oppia nitens TaxID=1686743 RepID=UPI0023DB6F31|nr:3-oxoacyl-[acyl-carrier-protein] reductase FabG-like [Oppia nitens]
MTAAFNLSVRCDYPIEDYLAVKNSRDFTGKVVLVTGSNSGIGAGIVKLFSILGASVVVTGRNASRVVSVAREVQHLSPKKLKPLEVVADLTKQSQLKHLVRATIERFGKLDVLVNNAAIMFPMTTITDDSLMRDWDLIFNTNLRAIVELIHEALPYLVKTNGTIINISSDDGVGPTPPQLAYSTAKYGLNMLTRNIALELGSKGIRVNNVIPGGTQTENTSKLPGVLDYFANHAPLKRVGQPLDIAKAVIFFASSDAKYITAADLIVDGGIQYNWPAYLDGLNVTKHTN